MSPFEAVAAALGVINIVLLIRRNIWNYAFGLAMVALYAPIFFEQRLYSDALLQLFFFAVQLYGWWEWRRSAGRSGEVVVERLGWRARALWASVATAAWLAWSSGMHHFTDAVNPYWDGAVAAMSVTAQAMLARRLIENWPLWGAVDVVAIALYWSRDLRVTALLYALFLLMSLLGWRAWLRAERENGGETSA
ncbi:nicotinamide riboside transporter PnuC [Sphingomonas sp.]|uniref:nicotinamide riboside transporter PnuC n=1 Tax=Sphingomonas sp. TaxID=28214 RepID=UPI000DB8AE1B|nr:nicotinamide riboside transporter PnuC [Sphingomonas sp.]PZU09871.1 MAG: nicotinamide mononucleotide transporter [Sphingomonas sp.]